MREPIHSLLEAARSRNPRKSDAEADEDVAENSLSKGREEGESLSVCSLLAVPCQVNETGRKRTICQAATATSAVSRRIPWHGRLVG
jgi:hypothetical protein